MSQPMTPELFVQQEYKEAIDKKFILRDKGTNGVYTITFNRARRANGFTNGMYRLLAEYVNEASRDSSVKVILLRGEGKHFCSGNDLGNFSKVAEMIGGGGDGTGGDAQKQLKAHTDYSAQVTLEGVTTAFLECAKPIIALVQGASVGIGFTLLGVCDIVYAAQSARFQAPLVRLAQGPEMLSSLVFPKLFGRQRAFEIIALGGFYTAQQMEKWGLVNRIAANEQELLALGTAAANEIAQLDLESLVRAKSLLNAADKEAAQRLKKLELENLAERWSKVDVLFNAIGKHMAAKPNL